MGLTPYFWSSLNCRGHYTLTLNHMHLSHATFQSIVCGTLRWALNRDSSLSYSLRTNPIVVPILLFEMMPSAGSPGEFRLLGSLGEEEPQARMIVQERAKVRIIF